MTQAKDMNKTHFANSALEVLGDPDITITLQPDPSLRHGASFTCDVVEGEVGRALGISFHHDVVVIRNLCGTEYHLFLWLDRLLNYLQNVREIMSGVFTLHNQKLLQRLRNMYLYHFILKNHEL